MNRHLSPDTKCYRCTHLNGDHDHPGGACGCIVGVRTQCPCPGMAAFPWSLHHDDDHTAAWEAWDAAHNAEATP